MPPTPVVDDARTDAETLCYLRNAYELIG